MSVNEVKSGVVNFLFSVCEGPIGKLTISLRPGAGRPGCSINTDCVMRPKTHHANSTDPSDVDWCYKYISEHLPERLLMAAKKVAYEAIAQKQALWHVQIIEQAERKARHQGLGITRGPEKGSKHKKPKHSKPKLEEKLSGFILSSNTDELKQKAAASSLGYKYPKALARDLKQFGETRRWRQIINDTYRDRGYKIPS